MAVFETTKSSMTSNCIYFNWYRSLFDNNGSDDIKTIWHNDPRFIRENIQQITMRKFDLNDGNIIN